MRPVRAAVLPVAVLQLWLLGGCSSSGDDIGATDPTSGNGAPVTPPPQLGFKALFQPTVGILPYPNDLYFSGSTDGTLNLPLNAFSPGAAAINALDGFSTTSYATARFGGGAINPASLTAANIRVVRLVVDNATKAPLLPPAPGGALPQVLGFGVDYTASIAQEAGSGGGTLVIRPTHPLDPSTGPTDIAYLILLTNGITDTSGAPAVADADYATVRDAAIADIVAGLPTPTCATVTNATLNAICRLTFAHLRVGAAVGITPTNVVLTFAFSTQSTRDTLGAVSQGATAHPIGAVFTGLNTHQVNPGLPGFADIWSGTLEIPYFLSKTAPLTGSWRAAGPSPAPGIDPNSRNLTRFNPIPGPTELLNIPLLVAKPNATSASAGVRPANGWPVVIFQHGITGDRSQMLAIADAFANVPGPAGGGFVVVAIDQPLHGLPATSPLYQASNERHFNLDLIDNATGAAGPDGNIDPSGTHFINLTSLLTSRDNLREAIADLITLARSVPNLDLTGDGVPDIDPTRIHFVGHSLGGIVGTGFVAFNPGLVSATLAMPGGQIAQLLQDSPAFSGRINAGLAQQGLVPGTTLYNQFFRDAQTVVDSGDPWNHAAAAAANAPIHLIQVVGATPPPPLPDQVVPNSATARLITTMNLTRVSTPGPNSVSHGFVNFVAGDHGSILSPAASLPATVEMQSETVTFAVTSGTVIPIADPAVVQP
jgi:pimeloyl-ACP methyl ester carboxylesterase